MTTRVLALVAFLLLGTACRPAKAQMVPHWTPEVQLRLAQCFVAEAQHRTRDWRAIAHTLHRWWEIRRKRHDGLSYLDVVTTVCSVHRVKRRTGRQRMIRALRPRAQRPAKPQRVRHLAAWKKQWAIWKAAYALAGRWQAGKEPDPCRNRAVIWGSPDDGSSKWDRWDNPHAKGYPVVRLRCSNRLKNEYYRRMTYKERKAFFATQGVVD